MDGITGTKLPAQHECPVDNALYRIVSPLVNVSQELGLTPNCVTVLGAIASYYCLRAFAAGRMTAAMTLWAVHYVLDCVDGMQARRYGMETAVGDMADHLLDLVAYSGFLAIAFVVYVRRGASPWPLVACGVFGLLAINHLSCQQLHDAGRNAPIWGLASLPVPQCRDAAHVLHSRWFGTGTANVVILAAMYFYCRSKLMT